ncbi:MAG: hypothetical protein Q4G38_02630 [Aeriscardovia aeriphila]|nr:hypothetical protein [Aeriscardovia aeriphila]
MAYSDNESRNTEGMSGNDSTEVFAAAEVNAAHEAQEDVVSAAPAPGEATAAEATDTAETTSAAPQHSSAQHASAADQERIERIKVASRAAERSQRTFRPALLVSVLAIIAVAIIPALLTSLLPETWHMGAPIVAAVFVVITIAAMAWRMPYMEPETPQTAPSIVAGVWGVCGVAASLFAILTMSVSGRISYALVEAVFWWMRAMLWALVALITVIFVTQMLRRDRTHMIASAGELLLVGASSFLMGGWLFVPLLLTAQMPAMAWGLLFIVIFIDIVMMIGFIRSAYMLQPGEKSANLDAARVGVGLPLLTLGLCGTLIPLFLLV